FQAEDGIRDDLVTGVQTCALPIFYVAYPLSCFLARPRWSQALLSVAKPSFHFQSSYIYMLIGLVGTTIAPWMQFYLQAAVVEKRSEERRVGKGWRKSRVAGHIGKI